VIYTSKGGKAPLSEHKRFSHPSSRLHDRELTTDLPGRAYDSSGQGQHAMEQPLDPKKHEALLFAKELSDFLHHACTTGSCDKLYVAAAPAFLGILREHYSKPVQTALAKELDLNMVSQAIEATRSHLPEYL
jgi:protein required for attachment to host cells